MINTKELVEKLPGSWDELKLKDYQKFTEIEVSEQDEFDGLAIGVDNTLKVISTLSGVSIDNLEQLSYAALQPIAAKIAFMLDVPKPGKESSIKWKTLEEITYNDFITFMQLSKEPFVNLHKIIKAFSKIEMTEEQVADLSTQDAVTGFFLLRQQNRKFFNNSIKSSAIKLFKQTIRELLKTPFRVKWLKAKS